MKKNYIFVLILLNLFSFRGIGQDLLHYELMRTNLSGNTTWLLFGTDTMFISQDGISYTAQSFYSASGGILSVYDINPSLCLDSGFYSYTTSSTVTFTLIDDDCFFRSGVMTDFPWTHINTGISTTTPSEPGLAWSSGRIMLNTQISGEKEVLLSDVNGRIVYRLQSADQTVEVPVNELSHGLYFGRIVSGTGVQTFRFFNQAGTR